MGNVVKVSEAASLGIHAMYLLGQEPDLQMSTKEMAQELEVSENHLSKVLQRLGRVGLVKSIRGPKGGFTLGRPATEISLLMVFEAIEGPIEPLGCLLGTETCHRPECRIGGFFNNLNRQVKEYLSRKKLAEVEKDGSLV